MCVCACAHVCTCMSMCMWWSEHNFQYGSWGLNSGPRAWQQTPFVAEPSHEPCFLVLCWMNTTSIVNVNKKIYLREIRCQGTTWLPVLVTALWHGDHFRAHAVPAKTCPPHSEAETHPHSFIRHRPRKWRHKRQVSQNIHPPTQSMEWHFSKTTDTSPSFLNRNSFWVIVWLISWSVMTLVCKHAITFENCQWCQEGWIPEQPHLGMFARWLLGTLAFPYVRVKAWAAP